jgi:hypothetical protein
MQRANWAWPIRGKVWIADFIFTRLDLVRVSSRMASLKQHGSDAGLRLVSFGGS